MKVEVRPVEVPLDRPFTISRGSQATCTVVHLRLEHAGHVAWGEGCPSPAVTAGTVEDVVDGLRGLEPADLDPDEPEATLAAHPDLVPAARAALDLALVDLGGKRTDRPAHELLGFQPGMQASAATVTLTDPGRARAEATGWFERGFVRLKVKVGTGPAGLDLVRAVREMLPRKLPERFPQPQLWVDANEALDVEGALELLPELDELGVALLEQPLPRDDIDGLARLLEASPFPIVVDEAIQGPEDVRRFAGLEGPLGVNIKVQKVGGLHAARACLAAARDQRRPVMVGCNIETGLGIAAGATLAGEATWADLDGNQFLAYDPFPLPRPRPGFIGTLEGPGLGVQPDARYVPTVGPQG